MGHTVKDTKQKLIDTALELIWKSSYGSVSVDDICKAADVKKGSFYHYFPSKVDLAVAAMEEGAREMKAGYDAAFSPGLDPVTRFEKLADYLYEGQKQAAAVYGRVCGCPSASLGSEMAGQESAICAKFEEISRHHRRYYENALRDLVEEGKLPKNTDVKIKAEEIHAYIVGQLIVARIQNNLEPLKRDLKTGMLRTLGINKLSAA